MKETNIKIHDVSHGVIVQPPLPLSNPISWFIYPILFHGSSIQSYFMVQ